jgi:hypothetical protein
MNTKIEYAPQVGDLVRYGNGSTDIMLLSNKHGNGWHGRACLGGYLHKENFEEARRADLAIWMKNADYRYRANDDGSWSGERDTPAHARADLEPYVLRHAAKADNGLRLVGQKFTDTPQPRRRSSEAPLVRIDADELYKLRADRAWSIILAFAVGAATGVLTFVAIGLHN